MLKHALEHGAGSRVGVLAGLRHAVRGIEPIRGDIGSVRVSAARHGDVEHFPGRGGFDECVCGIDGDALGTVRGDGVAEVEVLGNVGGGQQDPAPAPHGGWPHEDRAVIAHVRHDY